MIENNLPTLNEEQIKSLEAIYPRLNNFVKAFESVLSEPLATELKEIDDTFKSIFAERWEVAKNIQKSIDNQKGQILEQIAQENNLTTKWAVAEIEPSDFDNSFSVKPVKCLIFENTKIKFDGSGQALTWLEAWKYADQLINQTENNTNASIVQFHEVIPKSGFFSINIKRK